MATEYQHVFYTGLPFFGLLTFFSFGNGYQEKFSLLITVLLALYCVYVFGHRPVEIYTDTHVYVSHLNQYKNDIDVGIGFTPTRDIAWYSFVWLAAYMNLSGVSFLTVSAILFVIPLLGAFYRIFNSNILLPFLLLCSCFFFWSLGTNVLRTGVGLSFFLLGISYMKDGLKIGWLPLALSVLFHLSFILPVCVWLLFVYFEADVRYLIGIWFLFLILACLNIGILNHILEFIDSSMVNDRIDQYIMPGTLSFYRSGFRLDFVSFSVFFGIVGLFLRKRIYTDHFYDAVLNSYIIINAFFLITMNIPFSDRFAALSWILIPLICSYPLIKSDCMYWEYIILFFSLAMFLLSIILY